MLHPDTGPDERPLDPQRLLTALESISSFFAVLGQDSSLGDPLRAAAAEAHRASLEAADCLFALAEEVGQLRERTPAFVTELRDVEDTVGRLSSSLQEEEWPSGR